MTSLFDGSEYTAGYGYFMTLRWIKFGKSAFEYAAEHGLSVLALEMQPHPAGENHHD